MSDEHVSIARNEAETIYQPPSICSGQYDRDTRIKAYVRGRTAKPCDEQVEAVAKYLADTSDGWNTLTEADREPFRETAAEILQAARKAVM